MESNVVAQTGTPVAPAKKRRSIIITLLICAAVTALLEFCISSRKTVALALSSAPRTELDLTEASYGSNALAVKNGVKIKSKGRVTFKLDGIKVEYIALEFEGVSKHSVVSVYAKDSAWQNSLRRYQAETVWLGDGRAVIGYDSAGGATDLALEFDDDAKDIVITGITLNYAFGCGFYFVRWLVLFGIAAAVVLIKERRLYKAVFDPERGMRTAAVYFALVVCCVSAALGSVKEMGFSKYPFEKPVEKYTCYQQQTDAFLKGRLDLDISFNASELAALDDPYDYGVRKANVSSYARLWDRAYNAETGKVYSYFGVAPVLLIYLPITALTGYMPGDGFVSLVLTLAATFAFAAALLAVMRYFSIKADVVTTFGAICALCCGSLIYVLNAHPSMYYSAVISGMLFFALLLNFAFRAAMAQTPKRRKLLLCLAGICVVLIVASRPNAFFYAVMLIPLFVDFFVRRKLPAKQKLTEFAFAAVPVAVGAAAIMWYNAARFGSPFDFGATSQLTFYDMGYCGLEIYKFFPSLYHYFLQPVAFTAEFPFMDIASNNLGVYRSYEYVYTSAGVMNFPAAWGALASLSVTKGSKVKRWTYIAAVLAAVFVAFADFCLAGSHIRYMGDLMFPLCLIGVLVLCEFVQLSAEKSYAVHVRAAVWIVFGLTILVASALLFANEADNIRNLAPQVFRIFEKLFE